GDAAGRIGFCWDHGQRPVAILGMQLLLDRGEEAVQVNMQEGKAVGLEIFCQRETPEPLYSPFVCYSANDDFLSVGRQNLKVEPRFATVEFPTQSTTGVNVAHQKGGSDLPLVSLAVVLGVILLTAKRIVNSAMPGVFVVGLLAAATGIVFTYTQVKARRTGRLWAKYQDDTI